SAESASGRTWPLSNSTNEGPVVAAETDFSFQDCAASSAARPKAAETSGHRFMGPRRTPDMNIVWISISGVAARRLLVAGDDADAVAAVCRKRRCPCRRLAVRLEFALGMCGNKSLQGASECHDFADLYR
ncbi:MAG TPA: hypothetical protein VHW24_02605, partial [Bryobacteraceae bacterium]|nr:hypothetical protein [Bryobacteraceae bacterium]